MSKHKNKSLTIPEHSHRNSRKVLCAFLTAVLMMSLMTVTCFATGTGGTGGTDMWAKATEIMKDVYTQVVAISTIAAVVIPDEKGTPICLPICDCKETYGGKIDPCECIIRILHLYFQEIYCAWIHTVQNDSFVCPFIQPNNHENKKGFNLCTPQIIILST